MRTNARWLALALTLAALLGLCLGAAAEEGTITFDKTVIGLPEAAVEKLSYRYLITLTGAEGLTGVETAIVDTARAGEAAEEDFALLPVTDSVLAVEGVRDVDLLRGVGLRILCVGCRRGVGDGVRLLAVFSRGVVGAGRGGQHEQRSQQKGGDSLHGFHGNVLSEFHPPSFRMGRLFPVCIINESGGDVNTPRERKSADPCLKSSSGG